MEQRNGPFVLGLESKLKFIRDLKTSGIEFLDRDSQDLDLFAQTQRQFELFVLKYEERLKEAEKKKCWQKYWQHFLKLSNEAGKKGQTKLFVLDYALNLRSKGN